MCGVGTRNRCVGHVGVENGLHNTGVHGVSVFRNSEHGMYMFLLPFGFYVTQLGVEEFKGVECVLS